MGRNVEARDERERYLANPLRLLRCAVELGFTAVRTVDDALYDFPEYNETNYPPITNVEAPLENEQDLLQGVLF